MITGIHQLTSHLGYINLDFLLAPWIRGSKFRKQPHTPSFDPIHPALKADHTRVFKLSFPGPWSNRHYNFPDECSRILHGGNLLPWYRWCQSFGLPVQHNSGYSGPSPWWYCRMPSFCRQSQRQDSILVVRSIHPGVSCCSSEIRYEIIAVKSCRLL